MEFALAKSITQSISELIEPAGSRAEIAGSIRRKKPEVKDIEIVARVHDYDLLYKMLSQAGRFIKPSVTYEMFISMNALSSFTMATGK